MLRISKIRNVESVRMIKKTVVKARMERIKKATMMTIT
jgi:hypothetical protein